jgi:exopolysaccharide production protein ExoZ
MPSPQTHTEAAASDQPTKRLIGLQALRGAAALMVLLHHLVQEENLQMAQRLLPHGLGVGWVGVDLFFVLSGYIIVTTTMNSKRGGRAAAAFLSGRIFRVFPAYWFATSLQLLLIAAFGAGLSGEGGSNLVSSLLLLPQGDTQPIVAAGWTLVHEMLFYVIVGFLLTLPKQFLLPGLFFWGASTILAHFAGISTSNDLATTFYNPLNNEFLLGAGIALIFQNISKPTKGIPIIVGATLLFAGGIFAFYALKVADADPSTANWLRFAFIGCPAALIVAGVASLNPREGTFILPAGAWVGDFSYSLYLIQKPIIVVGALLTAKLPGILGNLVFLTLAPIVAISLAFLLYHLVEKPTHKLGQRLSAHIRA